jgi:hypothetical protein
MIYFMKGGCGEGEKGKECCGRNLAFGILWFWDIGNATGMERGRYDLGGTGRLGSVQITGNGQLRGSCKIEKLLMSTPSLVTICAAHK